MATKQLLCWKQHIDRYGNGTGGCGLGEQHLPIGRAADGWAYRVFLHFQADGAVTDWNGVGQIVSATLHLRTAGPVAAHGTPAASPAHQIRYVNSATQWIEHADAPPASENQWGGSYRDSLTRSNSPVIPFTSPQAAGQDISIDVTDIYELLAPATVKRRNGQPGGGVANNGLHLMNPDEGYPNNTHFQIFLSRNPANAGPGLPYVTLTYDPPASAPDTPTGMAPVGANIPEAQSFVGTFSDPNPGDTLSATNIRLFLAGGVTPLWDQIFQATSAEQAVGQFSVPIPAPISSGVDYEWDARTQDQTGRWGAFSSRVSFRFQNLAPSVTLDFTSGSHATLAGVQFGGTFSDPDGDSMQEFRIQLRVLTTPGHPDWNGNDHKWDSGEVLANAAEVAANHFSRAYGGAALTPATYSWRAQVRDTRGAWSAWAYGQITLTAAWNPDPGGAGNFLTGYNERLPRPRIVIRAMDANRGPKTGAPLAIIEDAANIGASGYRNAGGECYFTLPASHPQVGEVEPYKVHYAIEEWRGDRFVEIFAGVVTDFDATANDVVFYGTDYLGMMNKVVDSRYDPTAAEKSYTDGGSKYSDVTITTVITDQLTVAKAKSDSPVKFIAISSLDNFAEKVTIYSTFTPVLDFITGLMESHQQGTGKRSRFWVRRTTAGTGYEFLLKDNPGVIRDNLRMEYGGLVQGFRLTGFGDFASFSHGIGKARDGANLYYTSEQAVGIDPTIYGRIEQVRVWDDVTDKADLQRRLKQAAATAARVGKRIAMALRVDALRPFDGWDISDVIPIDIDRGAVNTQAYGSGYWVIVGVEWQVYPDGHTDLTLVILPREDDEPPDPDLIPTDPILAGQEWGVGYAPPVQGVNVSKFYVDLTTGITYQQQPDGSYTPVQTPPAILPPTGVTMTSALTYDTNGDAVIQITVALTQRTGTNYRGAWVEITAVNDGTGNPVWDNNAIMLFIPSDENSATFEGVAGSTMFWGRAWSVDFVGTESAKTAAISTTSVADPIAPNQPTNFVAVGSIKAILASWDATTAPDLAFYEFRYAIDNGSGTGPGGTPNWIVQRARTTFLYVGNLGDQQRYWCQVRAIDRSGNVDDAGTTRNFLLYPDVGYTALQSVDTTLVDADLIALGAIQPQHIDYLDASLIETGTLRINTAVTSMTDGIRVFADDGAGHPTVEIGRWDETGIYLRSAADLTDYIQISSAGLTVYVNGVPVTVVDSTGLNASGIVSGALPGGQNLLSNSQFEMGAFSSATTVPWTETATAEWTATRVGSDTNVTTNAFDLQQTAATY